MEARRGRCLPKTTSNAEAIVHSGEELRIWRQTDLGLSPGSTTEFSGEPEPQLLQG